MKEEPNLENTDILVMLRVLSEKYGQNSALQIIGEKIRVRKFTYEQLYQKCLDVSAFMITRKIQIGTHSAILSENRPEWGTAFLGILSAACVAVPIDAKSSFREIAFMLNDSKAECLFLSQKFINLIHTYRKRLPYLKYLICFDGQKGEDVFSWDDLKWSIGLQENRSEHIKSENTAIITYTQGVSGLLKGVEITYRNLFFQVNSLRKTIKFSPRDALVSIVPLNYGLEFTAGLIVPLSAGAVVTYHDTLKPAKIIQAVSEARATGMICTPFLLDSLYEEVLSRIKKLPRYEQKVFKGLLCICRVLLKFNIRAGRVIFQGFHKKLGKRFKYFILSAAPWNIEREKNFRALGFKIMQGYGLTETLSMVTLNMREDKKAGSAGRVLPGVEVRILKNSEQSAEGEILVKGQMVMKGYYHDPQRTANALKQGWLYTGDLGYFDQEGFLYVRGRVKSFIAVGIDQRVFPEELEQVINTSRYIKEICVLGKLAAEGVNKGKEEVCAVIVPNLDSFSKQERETKDRIRAKISCELEKLSENLTEYKRVSNFFLCFRELPKTSTGKIKRREVVEFIESLEREGELEINGQFLESMTFEKDELIAALKEIVSRLAGIPCEVIHFSSYLSSDLGIDSLQRVELVCNLNKMLGVNIPAQSAYDIYTFYDLVRFVKEYKRGRREREDDLNREVKVVLRRDKIFYPMRLIGKLFLRIFFRLYVQTRVRGLENLPEKGAFIAAVNQVNYLDLPIFVSSLPLFKSLNIIIPATQTHFCENKVCRRLIQRVLNAFRFEDYGSFLRGLKLCRELLPKKTIVLFPEGVDMGYLRVGDFKPGLGKLAYELNLPIVPIYIKGSGKALSKRGIFVKPVKIEVKIGKSVYPAGENGYYVYKDIVGRVKEEIVKLKNS